MGIMTGNEEVWLRMMLEDKGMLTQMGLPSSMTEAEKNQVIEAMMGNSEFMTKLAQEDEEAFNGLMADNNNFEEPDTEKLENESPCDWMIREALEEVETHSHNLSMVEEALFNKGLEQGAQINGNSLKVGELYQITFPNGNTAKVKLNRIMTNSFGDDYIFENISGAEKLVSKSAFSISNEFPLPQQLLSATTFHTLS